VCELVEGVGKREKRQMLRTAEEDEACANGDLEGVDEYCVCVWIHFGVESSRILLRRDERVPSLFNFFDPAIDYTSTLSTFCRRYISLWIHG
jgi:hypothetical protein